MLLRHEKYCKYCDTIKEISEFYNQTKSSDGKQNRCKTCSHARRKQYHLENREKENARASAYAKNNKDKLRDSTLRSVYGISQTDYEKMRSEQKECCAICYRHETLVSRSNYSGKVEQSLHVDHCHTTGVVRGLLCFNCNALLGKCRDDPAVLQNAINYLKEKKKRNADQSDN